MNSTICSCCLDDAAHAGGRVVPPLLLQEKALRDEVVRPLPPFLADEAMVLRQRLDAVLVLPPDLHRKANA